MTGQHDYREQPVKLWEHCLQDYPGMLRRKLPNRKLGRSITLWPVRLPDLARKTVQYVTKRGTSFRLFIYLTCILYLVLLTEH